MAANQAYCVKCRKTVDIQNPEQVTMKNGRPATKGTCPTCHGSVFRIGAGSATAPAAASSAPAKAEDGKASTGKATTARKSSKSADK